MCINLKFLNFDRRSGLLPHRVTCACLGAWQKLDFNPKKDCKKTKHDSVIKYRMFMGGGEEIDSRNHA